MKTIKPFRFWSQKVLPLVYDDSLSYYEVLNKVVGKLNEVIDFVTNNITELVDQVIKEYFVKITYDESLERIFLEIDKE